MTNEEQVAALAAVGRGLVVASAVAAAAGVGTFLGVLVVLLLGIVAFPVGGLLAVASPFAGAYIASRIAPPVPVLLIGLMGVLAYMGGMLLSWQLGFPVIQGDAIDSVVFLVAVLMPTLAVCWIASAIVGLRASSRSSLARSQVGR